MKRAALIAAGIAVLAVFCVYWRVIIFLAMTLLYIGLHSPLVLIAIVCAALIAAILWARRRAA